MNAMIFRLCQLSVILIGSCLANASAAASYECFAKANANRGLNFDFIIFLDSGSVGGQIVLKTRGNQKVLGNVLEAVVLDRNNVGQRPAFDLTLGFIAEEDLSGLSKSSLAQVRTIEIFKSETAGGDEIAIYKLLSGSKQIGGTVLIAGMGTACRPR